MPIFFHVESHLWIAYLLFVNGLLASLIWCQYSRSYSSLVVNIEALLVSGFFISVLLNGMLALFIALLASDFGLKSLIYIYLGITAGLLSFCFKIQAELKIIICKLDLHWARLTFYLLVFGLLFINGGLIEQVTDAWWHLALAKKIAFSNNLFLEQGHLVEYSYRYYPPLWHANLAILSELSGESLPVFWNSLSAWIAVIKVISIYLLTLSLSGKRLLASLAAVLFVFLPGVGVSYLRVSAWPSHVSYAALFVALAVFFQIMRGIDRSKINGVIQLCQFAWGHSAHAMVLICLFILMLFAHQFEALLFGVGSGLYLIAVSLRKWLSDDPKFAPINIYLGRLVLVVLFFASAWFLLHTLFTQELSADKTLAYGLPILIQLAVLAFLFLRLPSKVVTLITICVFILLLSTINYQHIASLFFEELGLPVTGDFQSPLLSTTWFGGQLLLPSWHLQLRAGLLYSGLIALPLSLGLLYCKVNYLTLFCAATSVVVILLISSPYLYDWIAYFMNYHSPWRISILYFHVIIWASVLVYVLTFFRMNRIVSSSLFIVFFVFLAWDSRQHFNEGLVHLKRDNLSAQRNWNAYYSQQYLYNDASLRYQTDMSNLEKLVEPYSIVFADLATSYYASAYLPTYARNTHAHQGGVSSTSWRDFIKGRSYCYLDQPENYQKTKTFFASLDKEKPIYVFLNKDSLNLNLRYECLWHRREFIKPGFAKLGELIYSGEYLEVFRLYDSLSINDLRDPP